MTDDPTMHHSVGGAQATLQRPQRTEAGGEENNREQEQSTESSDELECPECGGHVVASDGETICEGCGLIIDRDQIDRGPEWRGYTAKERDQKSRTGSPLTQTLHDKGLSTQIGWQDMDAKGNALSAAKRARMNRLRTWHERMRVAGSKQRSTKDALSEVSRMASALGIPKSAHEVASVIYRRAASEDLIRGRSIEGVASSAVYAACRQEHIARTLDEIANVSRVSQQEIGRTYRYIARSLSLAMEPIDPHTYVPRFASDLDVDHEVERIAGEIIDASIEANIHSGKSPPAIAAGAIYAAGIVCERRLTQEVVSDVANVSKVTIRNRYQEQLEVYAPGTRV